MHYLHTLYIHAAPVAEIEIQVEPFLTWADELALELSVTDVDGQEHEIQDPELLSIVLARHRDELYREAVERDRVFIPSLAIKRRRAALSISALLKNN